MNTYRVTAPDGRTVKITGDTMPTEQELINIFEKTGTSQSVMDDRDGQVYNVPLAMDGIDTRFAIDTQHKGADKGSFFGKLDIDVNAIRDFQVKAINTAGQKAKSAIRGAVGVVGEMADTLVTEVSGLRDEQYKAEYGYSRYPSFFFGSDETQEEVKAKSKATVEKLESIRKRNQDWWQQAKESIIKEEEMDDLDKFFEGLGSGAASVATSVSSTLAFRNPAVAAGMMATLFGNMRKNEIIDEALEQGVDFDKAEMLGLGGGLIEGGLEFAGDLFISRFAKLKPIMDAKDRVLSSAVVKAAKDKIGKAAIKKIATRHADSVIGAFVKGFGSEALEEASQTGFGMGYENLVGLSNYSADEIYSNTLMAGVIGGITGGVAGGVGTAYNNKIIRQTNERIKNLLKEEAPSLDNQELQVMADSVQEMLFQESTVYIDELNKVLDKEVAPDVLKEGLTPEQLTAETRKLLKEKYKMSDEDINKTIQSALSVIDARNQFNEAYAIFNEGLSNAGRDAARADAEARILSARALAVARAEGAQVKDVLDRWNLQFRQTAFKDTDTNIDNWIKNNSARAMQKASTTQKGLLSSRSIADIISNLDSNVNSSLMQQALFQESLDIANQNAELDANNPAYEGETINIDGVERIVYNSNGDRIAQSEPALRNFYKWFGDSKVVDEQGRPLVVYHGTNKEFDSFDKKLLGTTTLAYSARQGFFFTDSEEVANSYGDYAAIYQPINELRKKQEMAERWGNWDTVDELTIKIEELDRKISQTPANQRGQKIYPVYLKADNVLEYDAKDEYFSDIGDEINDVLLKAKTQGKDGVVLKNLKDQPLVFDEKSSNHFVVFEPNQIKSTSNRGTFDPNDDRIYYQGGEVAVIGEIDTSGFKNEKFDYPKGWGAKDKLKAFAEDLAKDLQKAGGFGKYSVMQSNKSNATYIRLVKDDRDFSPSISIRLANHAPIHHASIATFYYDFNKTIKENVEDLNALVKGKKYGEVTNGKQQEQMIEKVYGPEDNDLWGIRFSFEGLEDIYYQSANAGSRVDYDRPSLEAIGSGDVYDVILEDKGVIKNQATHTNSAKNKSTSALEGQPDKISIANLLKNVKGIDKTLYRESYNPRKHIPNVRGGWAKNKILKYLKANGSLRGVGNATRMIAEFDSVEEFKEHMFYHGAKYGTSGGMKPSITMSDREVENVGGGGYGDKYWAISLSKSKKVAGNFATASGNGRIYPVLLVKNAKVIEMPELDDSADLEDHIEQLYTDGVDAVWIGDKDSGEQELAVINPKAIVNIGTSEFYRAYELGQPENPINIRSDEEIQKIYDYAKGFVREYPKSAPDEEIGRARNIVYWQSFIKEKLFEVLQDGANDPRGAYQNNIIYLFENADASTVIHELGHFFLDDMQKFADNETTKAQLEAIYKFVGSTDGKLTVEQHEYFANSFELYLLEGRAPNKTLEKVFFNFRKWISRIWSEIKRLSGIKLTPEIRKVFDEMLGGRGLDFAMQMSGARMAEALERGHISQWQINRAMQVVYEGKASKKDMSDLIKELRNGMKVDEFIAKIREYEKKPANTNRQELREWDYMMLRSQLESLSFRKDKVKARIERLLKWTEPRSQNGKLVGRFPSKELNDAFEHYRTLANMDKNEAKEKRKKNIEHIETQIMSGGEYDIEQLKFENRLLGYAIGDIQSKELVKLYDALSESYNLGRLSSNVTGEVKRKRRERLVEDAKDVLTNGFSLTDKINPNIERSKLKQFLARWGVSQQAWSGLLDTLSMNDKTSRTGQSKLSRDLDIFEAEQEKYRGIAIDSDSISSKLERALSGSANPAQSVNRYINNELDKEVRIEWMGVSNPKENNPKNQKPLLFSKTFTKDKLIDIWMKAQDEETLEIMHKDPVNQYNKEFLQKVEDELTDDDIAVAKALFDFYDENYTKFNAFYEDHFAVSLPKSRYYSPRSMIVNGVDIDDGSNRGYVGFSGAKERTAKPGSAVVNIKGAFRVLNDYVNKQNHFMAYADKMIDINAVLANREVKSIISSLFGDEMNSIIKKNIENLANNGNDKIDLWGKRWNRARARFAKSVLAVKPALAIKQLTSFPAYWENVGTKDFVLGVLDFFAHPKEAIETLGNTTLMKTRDVNIIRDFEQMSKSDLFKKIKKVPGKIRWNDFMMWNIKFGDRGAIYMGGWALYKSELKKNLARGMDAEKAKALALETFERVTDETQQSGRISQQSSMQQNSATRVFTMFQSSQNQYLRKEINAIRGLVTGRIDKKQAAKTLFIFHVLLPCFFQVVSDGFRFNKENLLRAAVLGSLNGWFLLNKVLESIWSLLFEDEKWGNSRLMVRSFVPSVGSFEDMINAVMDIAEDDIELEDVLDIVKPLGEITGLPLKYALDVYKNAGNYAEEGEYGKEVMLWTGWSPYALRDFEEE